MIVSFVKLMMMAVVVVDDDIDDHENFPMPILNREVILLPPIDDWYFHRKLDLFLDLRVQHLVVVVDVDDVLVVRIIVDTKQDPWSSSFSFSFCFLRLPPFLRSHDHPPPRRRRRAWYNKRTRNLRHDVILEYSSLVAIRLDRRIFHHPAEPRIVFRR